MLVGSETSVDGTTVQLVQLADTNVLSQVDVSGRRSSSLVEPGLGFLGRQLVAGRGLDELNVAGNLQLTLTLQELGVGVDELLSWNVSAKLVYNQMGDNEAGEGWSVCVRWWIGWTCWTDMLDEHFDMLLVVGFIRKPPI